MIYQVLILNKMLMLLIHKLKYMFLINLIIIIHLKYKIHQILQQKVLEMIGIVVKLQNLILNVHNVDQIKEQKLHNQYNHNLNLFLEIIIKLNHILIIMYYKLLMHYYKLMMMIHFQILFQNIYLQVILINVSKEHLMNNIFLVYVMTVLNIQFMLYLN